MLRRASIAIAVLGWTLPVPTLASCAVEAFGAQKTDLCDHSRCGPIMAPKELKAIRRGVMTESIAAAIFEPMRGHWVAVDLDKRQLVSIWQHPDSDLAWLREEKRRVKNADSVVIRKITKGYVQIVSKRTLSKAELEEVVCAANRAWKAPDQGGERLADLVRGSYVRDGRAWKEFGGDISTAGEAAEMLRRLDEINEKW